MTGAVKPSLLALITFLWMCFSGFNGFGQTQTSIQNPPYSYSSLELDAVEDLIKNKKYQKAITALDLIIEKATKSDEVLYALYKKANLISRLNGIEEAVEILDSGLEIAKEKQLKDSVLLSLLYKSRARFAYLAAEFTTAASYINLALESNSSAKYTDHKIHYDLLNLKYDIYLNAKYPSETLLGILDDLNVIVNSHRQLFPPYQEALLNTYYMVICSDARKLDLGLIYAIRVNNYIKENFHDMPYGLAAFQIHHILDLLINRRDYEGVIGVANDFISMSGQRIEENQFASSIYKRLASAYRNIGQYESALKLYQSSLSNNQFSWSTEKLRKTHESDIHLSIARTHEKMRNYLLMRHHVNESFNLLKSEFKSSHISFLSSYSALSSLEFLEGNYESSKNANDAALKLIFPEYDSKLPDLSEVEFYGSSYSFLPLLLDQARTLADMAEANEKGLSLLKRADHYIDYVRQSMTQKIKMESEDMILYISSSYKIMNQVGANISMRLYNLTGELKYADKALTYVSWGKSQLFLEQLGVFSILKGRDVSEEVRNSFLLANKEFVILDQEIQRVLEVDVLDDRLLPMIEKRSDLNDTLQKLKQEIISIDQGVDSERLVSMAELRQRYDIRNGKILIEYLEGAGKGKQGNIWAFAVSESSFLYFEINRSESFNGAIENLLDEVSTVPTDSNKQHIKKFGESASILYQDLLAPILEDLGESSELVIVSDGVLNAVPFDLLLTDYDGTETSFKDFQYLMRTVSVTYKLSSEIDVRKDKSKGGKGILGFGFVDDNLVIADERSAMGSLPGALKEIEFLKSEFSGDFYLGKDGTKQRFLEEADDYDILHLAIHGKSDSINRFNSSLLFNGDQNYSLNTTDLYQTNLKSRLAVLSACESGLGAVSKGEGTFSIARGFAIAGVPSIVTTLWKVNDMASSKITQEFYQNLDLGMTKDKALQQAKLTFLEQSDKLTESPYYWGNFILIGDSSSMELSKKTNTLLMMVIILSVTLAIGLLFYSRRRHVDFSN